MNLVFHPSSLRPHLSITGLEGFEPSNGGSKGPCLTTWLQPKTNAKRFTKRFSPWKFYNAYCIVATYQCRNQTLKLLKRAKFGIF